MWVWSHTTFQAYAPPLYFQRGGYASPGGKGLLQFCVASLPYRAGYADSHNVLGRRLQYNTSRESKLAFISFVCALMMASCMPVFATNKMVSYVLCRQCISKSFFQVFLDEWDSQESITDNTIVNLVHVSSYPFSRSVEHTCILQYVLNTYVEKME